MSKSGPIALLGVDKTGNTVIVEIKRDKLPREALSQAIDYTSDIAEWSIEKIGEIYTEYSGNNLEETLTESFPDIDVENVNIIDTQRIILVGFSVESDLERMIEWLSTNFNVNINAIVLNYIKTTGGDELLTKTSYSSMRLTILQQVSPIQPELDPAFPIGYQVVEDVIEEMLDNLGVDRVLLISV